MKISVLGAGHGGCAMAAELALAGGEVAIYDKFPEVLEGLKNRGGVELTRDGKTGFAEIKVISTDIKEVISGAELIMVVTPAFAHREIAENSAPYLQDGQTIVLHPGRTGGAFEFRAVIKEKNPGVRVKVAEAQTLLYAARRTGDHTARIYGRKKQVLLAALPTDDTTAVLETICPLFPQFTGAANVLETSLLNIGAIFHPGPILLNMGRIENGQQYKHYHEGFTPSICRILEKVDAERVVIGQALGVPTKSAVQWLKDCYSIPEGTTGLCDTIRANKSYAEINAPSSIDVRYVTEDVPMSLVPLAALAQLCSVPAQFMNMLIDMADCVHQTDYRKNGRDLAKMGLEGLGISEIKGLV